MSERLGACHDRRKSVSLLSSLVLSQVQYRLSPYWVILFLAFVSGRGKVNEAVSHCIFRFRLCLITKRSKRHQETKIRGLRVSFHGPRLSPFLGSNICRLLFTSMRIMCELQHSLFFVGDIRTMHYERRAKVIEYSPRSSLRLLLLWGVRLGTW